MRRKKMGEEEKITEKPMENPENEQSIKSEESISIQEKNAEDEEVLNPQTFDFVEIRELIDSHFNNIKNLIRYCKEKDANVITLSKQIQVYRDGLEATLFKRIALELISYREDCRKSIREFENANLSKDEANKYLGYLQMDFENLIRNIDVEEKDGQYFYNGKSLDGNVEKITFSDVPEIEDIELPNEELQDTTQVMDYLKESENAIANMIKNNVILDTAIGDYIRIASIYEQGLYQIVLYPVIRHIICFYESLANRIQAKTDLLTDENANTAYIIELNYAVEHCDQLLSFCNVTIDSFVSDNYDPRKHRALRVIETDNKDLNGIVAFRYTDCYMMEEKIIYPSKVDIYKAR